MTKLGTPVAVDGPGRTSMNPGLPGVGVPSEFRSGERRPRRFAFEISSLALPSASPTSLRLLSVFSCTRRPELERSCSEPPSELGPLSPCGLGAGSCVWGGGFGTLGTVGVVVSGAGGAGTGAPGSWMSSRVEPGGTSTVTGTTSPEGSFT